LAGAASDFPALPQASAACHTSDRNPPEEQMLKKLSILIVAGAFGLAVYSPSASACPGADKDEVSIAQKDKTQKDKTKKDTKKSKKVADKKKAKDKDKTTDKSKATKKKEKDGKKVSRK
jgi:hypothetical protein